ncbi:MAG: ATP-binding protein [Pyrinomonadaceae bacterium]|nr:ATP-binding protein [Pyrinomonadaceae bacterium]
MTEAGGPANQSGILYQNSVAALFLGRLCDNIPRRDEDAVVGVRVEAPTQVDDIVVTHRDGHRSFIQAKESIRDNEAAWKRLWKTFEAQFWGGDFQRDRDWLVLHTGEGYEEHRTLRGIGERTHSSPTPTEWISRLNNAQTRLLKKISRLLEPEHSGEEELLSLFRRIKVEIRPLTDIERDMVPYWIPASNKLQQELFSLLRDLVARQARHRGSFTADGLRSILAKQSEVGFVAQPSLDELREIVRACGAALKQHKHSFGNTRIHFERAIVESIKEWALQPTSVDDKDNVSFLLDRAGTGKTVVARDVLCALEEAGATVLAIKADQLSGIASADELRANLRLPDSPERILRRLAADGPVTLLIDQIDALSLSLARDQKALNIVLDLVARARLIPGVRVVMSCRTFDLHNDPRLKKVESGRRFQLGELSDDEVRGVIDQLGHTTLTYESLSSATRELLRLPLHLDLFARAIGDGSSAAGNKAPAPTQLKSLQDLYTVLWQNVIHVADPQAPPVPDREQAIAQIVAEMNRLQRTSVAKSIFSSTELSHLHSASQWLASQGILIEGSTQGNTIPTTSRWTFLHQTFFDYCYAKNFAENRESLFDTIHNGHQGLFARPQIIHVLEYLRGTDSSTYLRELSSFLNASASEIRFHLRDHALRWFGAIADPTDQEWLIARRLFVDPMRRPWMLGAAQGNQGWFRRFRETLEHRLSSQDDKLVDGKILPYLYSMLEVAQAEVITMLRPYRGKNPQWDQRIRGLVRSIRSWHTEEASSLYEEMFGDVAANEIKHYYEIDDIAKVNPKLGCRLIRSALDRILEEQLSVREVAGEERLWLFHFVSALEVLNGSTIVEALNVVTVAEPEYFLATMLPWLERLVHIKNPPRADFPFFAGDDLSDAWAGSPYVVHHELNQAFIRALTELGRTGPDEFRQISGRFEVLPYQTPQRYMVNALRQLVESDLFVTEALDFLLADQRRLDLGDFEQYDTRQLIKALISRMTGEELLRLEAAILIYEPIRKYRGIGALRWRGLEKLYLLQCLAPEQLSQKGLRTLQELERKFPGTKASEKPIHGVAGVVGPPIPDDVAEKMSDNAWLNAMAKYKGGKEHKEPFKGGAMQQGTVLSRMTKEAPERFSRLAMRVPLDADQSYVRGLISGLSEAFGHADGLFNVIKRFAPVAERDTRSAIARALEKRAVDRIPEDLISLLEGYVRGPAGEDETCWLREEEQTRDRGTDLHGGPYSSYLNSVRGASLMTLMRTFDHMGDEGLSRKWTLLDLVAADESTALRAGAVEELYYLLDDDRERALSTFERVVDGHPALLCSHYADDFLYYAFFKHYLRMKPHIVAMMNQPAENIRQRGAELVCIAAISPGAMESAEAQADCLLLAESVITGSVPWRRGAARIYAFNLTKGCEACRAALLRLVDDDDEQIQHLVSGPFHAMREEHIFSLRDFIDSYAGSRALRRGLHEFTEYLWSNGAVDPVWALSVVGRVLDNTHTDQSELHFAGGEELIRLVLLVYTDPTVNDSTRERAMDLFDRLMEKFLRPAQKVLQEWDRN